MARSYLAATVLLNSSISTMNRKYLLPLVIIVMAGLTLLSGCSKDDDNPSSPNQSKKEMLVGKTWELKTAVAAGMDIKEAMELYLKKLKFNNDGTVIAEGTMGADTSAWVLTSSDTKIVVDQGTEDEYTLDIVSLSTSELKLKGDYEVSPTTTVKAELTYR